MVLSGDSIIEAQLKFGPFGLDDDTYYQRWRQAKLENYPGDVELVSTNIADIASVSQQEKQAIISACRKTNMAIYRSSTPIQSKEQLQEFCAQFGLLRLDHNLYADDDGISALHVVPGGVQHEYIPYSDKPIRWHTDGYYNAPSRKIRGMVLHCVKASKDGGENALLDHDMVYILIRDTNADYVKALMQADAMTIPANISEGKEIRPEQTGPVFSIDSQTGDLHMRYTARTKSIEWQQDTLTQEAVHCLEEVLTSASQYVYKHRLQPGEGIISNNVLHSRSAFTDGPESDEQRLMYRARYYDRIAGTSVGTEN